MTQTMYDTAMYVADGENGDIFYEHPRLLGRGVDVFNLKDEPFTPIIDCERPDAYPCKLLLDDVALDDSCLSGCARRTSSLSDSQILGNSTSQLEASTSVGDSSLSLFARRTFSTNLCLQHNLQRILIIGPPSLLTIHVIARLLETSHRVRLLYREYRGRSILRALSAIVKTRPSRLSFFCEDDLSQAVAGCDGVVYIDGPDTSDAISEEEVVKRYEFGIQNLFLALRSNGKSVRRVVMVTPASACFPVETTMIPREKRLQRAQSMALKEAERLSDKFGVPLTLILPSMVVGPSLIGECDDNVLALVNFAKQRSFCTYPVYFNFVDVRDVAESCELSLSSPTAEHQRYILSAGELSFSQIASLIKNYVPSLNPPEYELPLILAKAMSWSGVVRLFGFDFYKSISRKRFGWTCPLSPLKVQRDLGLHLRSASFAIMDALATTLNVPAERPASCFPFTCAHEASSKGKQKQDTYATYGLALSALFTLFGIVGYSSGLYIYSTRLLR